MRPDDIRSATGESADGYDIPIAAELRPLDAELGESGARARRMLHGRTQPTNYFAMDLRARLLSAYSNEEAAGSATLDVTTSRSQTPVPKPFAQPRRVETSPMAGAMPRGAMAAQLIVVGARWGLLAAAVATGLLIVGALGTGAIPR